MTGILVWLCFALMTLAFLFGLFIMCCRLLTFYQFADEFSYERRPSLAFLFARALATAMFRRQGAFAVRSPRETTDVDFLLDKVLTKVASSNKDRNSNPKVVCLDCRLDHMQLARYIQCCGYTPDVPINFVPPCFLETYFLPLMIQVAVTDDFKLSPLGLIHIGQTITQHTNIAHLLKEPFDLECGVAGYRFTTRGIEVDISMKVYDRREMCVWQGVATLLSRDKSVQKGGGQKSAQNRNEDVALDHKDPVLRVQVPSNCGVNYARCSGDWNPHHLWPWSASLLGFKKPIAHGMWTLSRCLTWLNEKRKVDFSAAFHIDAQFKRPLFMPGSSVFNSPLSLDKDKVNFHVKDEKSGAPQLVGTVTIET